MYYCQRFMDDPEDGCLDKRHSRATQSAFGNGSGCISKRKQKRERTAIWSDDGNNPF